MNNQIQLDNNSVKSSSKTLWLGMIASDLMFIVFIFLMHKFAQLEPFMPDLKSAFIAIGFVSIAAPFLTLGHFKKLQNKVRDNIRLDIDSEPAELQRYISFLVIGMALCSLPSMFGFLLYLMAGELNYALILICAAFFLGFMYKPEID
jgi:hypothetical protein